MNFRTTIVLLVLLAVVGGVILFTRPGTEKTETPPAQAKLLDINSGDVARVSFTNDEGRTTTVEKNADNKWRMTQPVKAVADATTVNALLEAISAMQTRGQVPADASTGLDQPRFKVELTTKDNKTIRFDVGSPSAAGDNLYVKREGQSQADVVQAGLLEQIDKPLKQWREARLFPDVAGPEITQLKFATTQQSIALEKHGMDWHMSQPTSMPADATAATDLAAAISSLRAEDFVQNTTTAGTDVKHYGLDQPVLSVSFSTAPATTQPSASEPSMTTIAFGRFDSVLKNNVYAAISNEPGIVTVAASTLDQFRNKKPLDLRDKKVVSIDPDHVTQIQITTETPATTQPTTREATHQTLVFARNKTLVIATPATMPATPTTMPATPATMPTIANTIPATTEPTTGPATLASTEPSTAPVATAPVEPPSKWIIESKGNAQADDAKLAQLLDSLHPLTVDKYLEKMPTFGTPSGAVVTLRIDMTDATHEIRMTDPGNGADVIASYNGLVFDLPRSVFEDTQGDFNKKPPMPAGMMSPSSGGIPFAPGMAP